MSRRFAVRLSVFYGASFAIAGAYMPFFPVWLQARGLEPAWIGIVMAMPTLARLTAVPVVTRQAERRNSIPAAMRITAMLTLIGFVLLATAPGPVVIAAMLFLTACVWTPTVPLTDAYALHGVARHGVSYGPIRLWGSAAYVGGVLSAGFVASLIAPAHLIWIIVALAGLSACASLLIEPLDGADGAHAEARPAPRLLRWPVFLAVLAAAALIQGSHAAYYVFSAIAWEAEGFSAATIAVLWSTCVMSEIVLFALSPRLRLSYSTLLMLGGAGALVRWIVIANQPSLPVLLAVQTLHAFSFGATHLGTMGLLARLVPHHSTATAQGYMTAAIGVVTAIASMVCGRLFGTFGQSIYFGMAAMGACGALLILLVRRRVEAAAAMQAAR